MVQHPPLFEAMDDPAVRHRSDLRNALRAVLHVGGYVVGVNTPDVGKFMGETQYPLLAPRDQCKSNLGKALGVDRGIKIGRLDEQQIGHGLVLALVWIGGEDAFDLPAGISGYAAIWILPVHGHSSISSSRSR